MIDNEETMMGGSNRAFQTTWWTVIGDINTEDETCRQSSLNDLLKRYWKPVYIYLRRKGYNDDQAKDLTQGFFQEVVLGRKLPQRADKAKGRFRTFLLTALDHYLVNVHRQQTSKKCIPKDKLIHLEQVNPAELSEPPDELTAEESFNYAWVSSLLDQMLIEVEADCRKLGMKVHWQLFQDRILQPIMENTSAPSISDICKNFGIESEAKASNMILTVKRRFQTALKRHLRQSVSSGAEVGEELGEIMQFFGKKRAR